MRVLVHVLADYGPFIAVFGSFIPHLLKQYQNLDSLWQNFLDPRIRLCMCAGSFEPSPLADALRTPCADPYTDRILNLFSYHFKRQSRMQ